MRGHRVQLLTWLLRSVLFASGSIAGLCFAANTVPDSAAAAAPQLRPSAAAFDALFKRLDVGDLSELDTPRQLQYLGDLRQLLPPGDTHRQFQLDSAQCGLAYTNAIKEGFAFAEAKLAEVREAKDIEAIIRFTYCRGAYLESLASARDAMAEYERGIELARASEDAVLLAAGLESRGNSNSVLGLHGKALADLLEAQRIYLQNQLPEAAARTLQLIGIAYRRLGYPDKAREYLTQSIERQQRVGDHESLFVSLVQMAFTDEDVGRFAVALSNTQKALEVANLSGNRQSIGTAYLVSGSILIDLQRHQEGLAALEQAEANFSAVGDVSSVGMLAFQSGRAHAGLGQHRKALDAFARAEGAPDFRSNQRYLELLHQARAQSLEASNQTAAALSEYKLYLAAREENARQRADQQAQMLREQFDTDRSNLENARLKAEQALKDRQVEALQRVRQWQNVAMALLALVLGLLALLAIRQLANLRIWKRMASIDPLTGVANRRSLAHFANNAMRQARIRHEPLSVLALDLDLFKGINDNYGHAAGDRALQHIARACQEALRERDLLGRIGGEEFLVVLPGSSIEHAADVAERLRKRVETLVFDDLPSGLRTTISVGVAEMAPHDGNFDDLEKRADAALYRAKAEGRNRIAGGPRTRSIQELGALAGIAAAPTGGAAEGRFAS